MNEVNERIKKWSVDRISSDKEIERMAYESTKTSQEYETTVKAMKFVRDEIIKRIKSL